MGSRLLVCSLPRFAKSAKEEPRRLKELRARRAQLLIAWPRLATYSNFALVGFKDLKLYSGRNKSHRKELWAQRGESGQVRAEEWVHEIVYSIISLRHQSLPNLKGEFRTAFSRSDLCSYSKILALQNWISLVLRSRHILEKQRLANAAILKTRFFRLKWYLHSSGHLANSDHGSSLPGCKTT